MALKITPEMIRAMYEYLAVSPPFIDWNIRDVDDEITFVVTRDRDFGWTKFFKRSRHVEIAISEKTVGSTHKLAETLAHEMIHLHLFDIGADRNGRHGVAFRACAEEVCAAHGWDARAF